MRLPESSVLGLDAMAFIYFFERYPRCYEASASIFRRMSDGEMRGVASTLILGEVLVHCFAAGEQARAEALSHAIRTYANLDCVPVDARIATTVARLRVAYRLRTPDAVHVATALEHGAEWFVTNDGRLRRVEPEGVRVWRFAEDAAGESS